MEIKIFNIGEKQMSKRHGTFAKYWAKNKNSSIGQVVCERCIASRGEEINIKNISGAIREEVLKFKRSKPDTLYAFSYPGEDGRDVFVDMNGNTSRTPIWM